MSFADSPGRSTSKADPVFIFDLDGTLLSVNSFPHWVVYMLRGKFAGLSAGERMALSFNTSKVLFQRKLLGHSHARTKAALQTLWMRAVEKDAGQAAAQAFGAILQNYVRPNLRSLLAEVKAGKIDALLATSAAGEYAQGFGKTLGFTHVLTTPLCTEPDRLENCGERKRDRVLATLESLGWQERRRIFFTDHAEDLPLIAACPRTLWFGPQEELPAIRTHAPQATIVFAGDVSAEEILRLAGGE